MSDTITLHAQTRTTHGRRSAQELRTQRMIPAVVYGHGLETRSLTVQFNPFEQVYKNAGESSLIDLVIDNGDAVKVIIQSVQYDPVKHIISHVDLHQVRMDEKIHAEVELVFTGESSAVKNLGGILIKNISHLPIECLPANLPHDITVDISALATFEDSIRVSDLSIPTGVTVLHDMEDTIAIVSEPRSQAELESLNEQIVEDVASVEVATAKVKEAEDAAAAEAKK